MHFLLGILDFFLPPRPSALIVRRSSIDQFSKKFHPSLHMRKGLIFLSSLVYRDKLCEAFILEAKFYKNKKAQQILGSLLAESLRISLPKWFPDDIERVVIVPIPLSKRRRRERGYNQTEEILACSLPKLMELALPGTFSVDTSLLRRIRHTLPQSTLSNRDRQKNVREAFDCARPADPIALYVLFDDVCSTGATLYEAECALRAAGASFVYAVSLAH
jgi:ComF family protein